MPPATERPDRSSNCVGSTMSRGRSRVALAVRSDLGIEAQVKASGATWIDRQLVARDPAPLGSGGFGAEVRAAMESRAPST